MTPHVESITVTATVDEHPPLDHLGEYRNEPGPDPVTVDRKERGDWSRGQKRYFVAAHADGRDHLYERMERFARGSLASCGIRAEATVVVNETVQTITSGGLWGVGSDAPDDYMNEVARDEVEALRAILAELGIDAFGERAEWQSDAPLSGEVPE